MKYFPSFLRRLSLLGLLIGATASCNLLQQDSPQDLNPDDAFGNPLRIEKTAVGMYDALQDGNFLGSRALIYSDVRSDDTEPTGAFSSLTNGSTTSGDGFAAGAWKGGYQSMYAANYVMRELTRRDGAGLPEEKLNQYMGEAKFIRALCHFTLVNLFAQPYNFTADGSHLGVPIQLNAPDGLEAYEPAQNLARSTVRDVYAQVESDLVDAIAMLPESHGSSKETVSRATKNAARGLLSRVYLYKGDYTNAARLAAEVIQTGSHELRPTAAEEFRNLNQLDGANPSNESIFFIAMSEADNPNTNAAIGQHYSPAPGLADIAVAPYRDALPTTDRRRLDLVAQRSGRIWTRKYSFALASGALGAPNRGAWIPIVRYPEILLNRAEALVKLSPGVPTDTTALHMLNLVRERSRPTNAPRYRTSTFATKQAFIDAILRERRFELAFEGHRLYDLFRNGLSVPARGNAAPAIVWKSDQAVLPIPASEIQRNPNLIPNPGY